MHRAYVHWRAYNRREKLLNAWSSWRLSKVPPGDPLYPYGDFACCNRPREAAGSTFTDFSPPRVWMLYHKPRERGRWRLVSWDISCSSSLLRCSIVSSLSMLDYRLPVPFSRSKSEPRIEVSRKSRENITVDLTWSWNFGSCELEIVALVFEWCWRDDLWLVRRLRETISCFDI